MCVCACFCICVLVGCILFHFELVVGGGEVGGEEEGMASLSQLKGYDWQCACLYFR